MPINRSMVKEAVRAVAIVVWFVIRVVARDIGKTGARLQHIVVVVVDVTV